jgi:hypothetical protein
MPMTVVMGLFRFSILKVGDPDRFGGRSPKTKMTNRKGAESGLQRLDSF